MKKSLSLFVFLLSFLPLDLSAEEYLANSAVKIARHDKRKTAYRLKSDGSNWGLHLSRDLFLPKSEADAQILSYEALPLCAQSRTELKEVAPGKTQADAVDVLFISKESSEQEKLSRKLNIPVITYEPALKADPKTGTADVWQELARFIRVECLPTRVRVVYVGSKRYIAFQEGEAVWTE